MLSNREISTINELDADITHQPDLVTAAGIYIDKLRTLYPEVCDDDLGRVMLEQASAMSMILATTAIADVPSALARLVTVWIESGCQLTKLTRELSTGNY